VDALSAFGVTTQRTIDAALLERRDLLSSSASTAGAEQITITAASASLADVQDAVDDAVDGDVIGIPNGSATWTGGIVTTKQIRIRAVNITPTPAGMAGTGATTRNVVISNDTPADSGTALFDMTSGDDYHVGIGGIQFNETSPNSEAPGPHVRFHGSGTKVPLIYECMFSVKDRISGQGTGSESGSAIVMTGNGGVMWNCVISGYGWNTNPGNVGPFNGCIALKKPLNDPPAPVWTDAHTIGTADTNGLINFYMEDCDCLIVAACPDVDEHQRAVIRYCSYQGSGIVTHGFTSGWGGRHVEVYNCEFLQVDTDVALGQGGLDPNFGRNAPLWIWCRAGTYVITDNFVDGSDIGYGSRGALSCSDNVDPPGAYPVPRQMGCGHTGGAGGDTFPPYYIDPIYIWDQTGGSGARYSVDVADIPDWTDHVQANRDYFTADGSHPNGQARPSYTKFTYPHPARAVVEGA
jgi:hypothetical protein